MVTWWIYAKWIHWIFALSIVIGSYQGVELIGISAGETKILKQIL